MFGHNDHQQHDTTLPAPASDGNLTDDQAATTAPQVDDTSAGEFLDDVSAPSTPPPVTVPDNVAGSDDSSNTNTTTDSSEADATPTDAPALAATPAPAAGANTDQLLDIKQQALQQLTPLIGHLDQTPEEKFRTTMMMIQAADNHALVQAAYDAAQQIEDEKVRAQALLDIVNEINYFTHNNSQES